ncbi:MAG: hypothetical protein ACK479_05490 [Fluviicola sp.]
MIQSLIDFFQKNLAPTLLFSFLIYQVIGLYWDKIIINLFSKSKNRLRRFRINNIRNQIKYSQEKIISHKLKIDNEKEFHLQFKIITKSIVLKSSLIILTFLLFFIFGYIIPKNDYSLLISGTLGAILGFTTKGFNKLIKIKMLYNKISILNNSLIDKQIKLLEIQIDSLRKLLVKRPY